MTRVSITVDFEPDCPPYLSTTFRGIHDAAPRLLALFADTGIRATYFTTGEVAERYPEHVDAVVANNDSTLARLQLDRTTADGLAFDPRRDLNGSGIIANNDSTLARLRLDSVLPPGEPGVGSRGEGESSSRVAGGAKTIWEETVDRVLIELMEQEADWTMRGGQ